MPVPAGAVAVICVALFTVKPLAAVAPKVTPVAPLRLVPVITTLVPPALDPDVGEIEVIVGAARTVVELEAVAVFDPPPPDNCTEGDSGLVALLAKLVFKVIVGPDPGPKVAVREHDPD